MFNQRRVQQQNTTGELPSIVESVSLLSYYIITCLFVLSLGKFGRDVIKPYGVCTMMCVNFIVY